MLNRFAGKQASPKSNLDRFREDVDEWKRAHDRVREVWHSEDLIREANDVYDWILQLDEDVRLKFFSGERSFPANFDQLVLDLLRCWLVGANELLPEIERHERSYEVGGAKTIRQSIRDAERMLSPDSATFRGDRIVRLQEQALMDHRAGLTEAV